MLECMAALWVLALGLGTNSDQTHRLVCVHSHMHAWMHCAVFTDRTLCIWMFSQVETFRPGKVRRLSVQIPAGETCNFKMNPSE